MFAVQSKIGFLNSRREAADVSKSANQCFSHFCADVVFAREAAAPNGRGVSQVREVAVHIDFRRIWRSGVFEQLS